MHEFGIINTIVSEARRYGNVKSVLIEIGELAPLTAKELEDALKKQVAWKIGIRKRQAAVRCSCGCTGKPKIIERVHDTVLFECQKCGSIPEIISGDKIVLKEVRVE